MEAYAVPWEEAEGVLCAAFPNPAEIAHLRRTAARGGAIVRLIGEKTDGYMVVEFVEDAMGKDILVTAIAGRGVTEVAFKLSMQIAAETGRDGVRAFTWNRGQERRLRALGGRPAGTLLRVDVP